MWTRSKKSAKRKTWKKWNFYSIFIIHLKWWLLHNVFQCSCWKSSIESDQIKITSKLSEMLCKIRRKQQRCDDKKSLQTSRKIWFYANRHSTHKREWELEKLDEINFVLCFACSSNCYIINILNKNFFIKKNPPRIRMKKYSKETTSEC